MKRIFTTILAAVLLSAAGLDAQVYKDRNASPQERAEDLLGRMTLEEKIDYIGGFKGFYIRGIDRLGLPEIKLTDGPVGTHKDGKSTAYPAGVLTASTWNRELIYGLGEQLARDSKARGVHVLLGPGMNIIRSPLCGRNFEYFTEDPYLNGQVALQYVKGLQENGVAATLKHFAANNQEWDRNNVSSDIDERTLHEIYLAGFKTAVQEGKAAAIMDSYNPVNGEHATQNAYLNNTVLRDMWAFDGVVMSDWSATYDAVAAACGGLDLEMPRAKYMNKENLIPAIRSGRVSESVIDEKVRRILLMIFRFGFFDNIQLDESIPLDNPDGAEVALQLAREGIVLLKNNGNLLPLDKGKIRKLAVIGPNAGTYISGGGSSYTFPFHSISVLEALQKELGSSKVSYAPGVPTLTETVSNSVFYTSAGSSERGLRAEYYPNPRLRGEPAFVKTDTIVSIGNGWHIAAENKGIPYDHCSMRWTGVIRPEKTAEYCFVVRGFDGFRLSIGDETVINEWRDQGITTKEAVLNLEKGKEYEVTLEYFANVHPVDISFGWRENRLLFDEAEAVAKEADAVILNVGFNESSERESNDRPFELPEYQDSLVRRIAAVNKNVILLLNAGASASVGGFIDMVPSMLHIWYPGQEGGTAVSEIVFGKTNPSGKLPVSFEEKWEDNASSRFYYDEDGDKRVTYGEGLFMGYRHFDRSAVRPLFHFGHGLSYTSFAYSGLNVTSEKASGTSEKASGTSEKASGTSEKASGTGEKASGTRYKVVFEVRNTGDMDGMETAQLYVRPVNPSVVRPYKELKGFEKKMVRKGETVTYEIFLDESSFSYYDVESHGFIVDPGKYEVMVGASSGDIRLRKVIKVR